MDDNTGRNHAEDLAQYPPHSARATLEWLSSNYIHGLEWQSPGQNPVEKQMRSFDF